MGRGFDHQDMAARLLDSSDTLEHILVAAPDVDPRHQDLASLCAEPAGTAAHRTPWDTTPPAPSDVAVFLIAQVAAVAAADPDLGERVCVFVVPEPGAAVTLAAIRDGMAAAGVAKFKWPERPEIRAELPVTKVGKLDKKAMREMLA